MKMLLGASVIILDSGGAALLYTIPPPSYHTICSPSHIVFGKIFQDFFVLLCVLCVSVNKSM